MYEPKRPTLIATGLFTLWVALLSLPMLQGKWLASSVSDQYPAGYAYRSWGAEWWHRLGHVPLWNPELFGGLPFVAAGHGDIFYPTSFLRLLLPVATVVNLNFVVHSILAGLFTYWLLRRLAVSWTGSHPWLTYSSPAAALSIPPVSTSTLPMGASPRFRGPSR